MGLTVNDLKFRFIFLTIRIITIVAVE